MSEGLSWFGAAYVAVFVSELVGDRSLFAVSALVSRFRALPVLAGIVPAFMAKALVAVLLGDAVARLPSPIVATASAITFLVSAIIIWRERPVIERGTLEPSRAWTRAVPAAFFAVFLTEWADVGQLTTATLAARSHAWLAVWLCATLALST